MEVASIHIYPVKSLGGIDVGAAEVQPWGLRDDRRWLVLNPDGSVLTARDRHCMLGVTATPRSPTSILLTSRDGSTLTADAPAEAPLVPTGLSRLESVRAVGAEADAWLSQRLGSRVRLGWLDDPRRRIVSAEHGGRPGDTLNLSDAGPILLTSAASLRRLNEWLLEDAAARAERAPAPMLMRRFRPSIVVDGAGRRPFEEDGWRRVRIGDVELRFGERCDRCVLTTIDPHTLVAGKEPLRTLARHRQRDHKTWFGIRLIPVTEGRIAVGDAVTAE